MTKYFEVRPLLCSTAAARHGTARQQHGAMLQRPLPCFRRSRAVAFSALLLTRSAPGTADAPLDCVCLCVCWGGGTPTQDVKDQEPFKSMTDPKERAELVKNLHKLKTDLFMELVETGAMPLRPGVKRLVGECRKRHRRAHRRTVSSRTSYPPPARLPRLNNHLQTLLANESRLLHVPPRARRTARNTARRGYRRQGPRRRLLHLQRARRLHHRPRHAGCRRRQGDAGVRGRRGP